MAFAIIANELILNIACWLASERRLYISPLDQRNVSLIDQKCLEQRKVSLTIKIHQRNLSLTDQKTVEQRNLSLLNRWPKPTRQRNLSLTDGKTVEQRNVSLLNGRKKPAPIAKPFANRRKNCPIAKGFAKEANDQTASSGYFIPTSVLRFGRACSCRHFYDCLQSLF